MAILKPGYAQVQGFLNAAILEPRTVRAIRATRDADRGAEDTEDTEDAEDGAVSLLGRWEEESKLTFWAFAFCKVHPTLQISSHHVSRAVVGHVVV